MVHLTHLEMSRTVFLKASRLWILPIACASVLITACGGLGTKAEFHPAAVDPAKYTITYSPSYLIGVEKANRKRIGGPKWGDCTGKDYCFNTRAQALSPELRDKIEERFDDRKGHFVSHIVRYQQHGNTSVTGDRLYSIYASDGTEQSAKCSSQGESGIQACFNSGWDALRHFKDEIAQRLKDEHITHIIVMSTGWKTLQPESISNYNEWIGNILAAAREDGQSEFRPLFIGFSWASDWERWPEGVDFVNKGHDADEVGLSWANVLIHEVVLPLKHDTHVSVVLIGHSFGARLLSRAIHSGVILPKTPPVQDPVDLFLGMQGAFSVNRFTANKGKEGHPYGNFSQAAKKIILTSSQHDEAVTRAIHTGDTFVGSAHAYELTREPDYVGLFEHTAIDAQGRWTTPPSHDSSKVALVEASSMIATNKPGTGGKAHSDVFDKESGRFIWQAIREFAP